MEEIARLTAEIEEELPTLRPLKEYAFGVGADSGKALPRAGLVFWRDNAVSVGGPRNRASHHRYVFILALKGEGTVCIDAMNLRIRPGEALLVQPYQYHGYTDLAPQLSWLFFTFEAEPGSWSELANTTHGLGKAEMWLALEVVRCWQETAKHDLLHWHLGLLLERISTLPGRHRRQGKREADLLVKVNRYALARLDRVVALDELARSIGLSESHLRGEFRRLTGRALGTHLRRLRLQHSCALLHTTDTPVGGIAEACGFDSVYSYSRAFKAAYGISPSDYRRREHF